MGKLESFGESLPKIETKIPAEVLKMNQDVLLEAKGVFVESNKLAAEATQGMGPRKGKEISDQLAECIEDAKKAVRRFTRVREECFPQGLPSFQVADDYDEDYKKAA
jgi:hypothetical protein